MSFAAVIDALAIPREALVDQRVPKKLLLEHAAPTPAGKRQIQDGIAELTWVAALKPTNIGVPAFRDTTREYLEIAVLTVVLRPTAKPPRLIELIHRAIPYPLVLVTQHSEDFNLSLAHKRWSQGEAGQVVIEDLRQVLFNLDKSSPAESSFLDSLALSQLPARDLFALYDGLLARLAALEAARITRKFDPPESPDRASAVRDGLARHAQLVRDLAILRARAAKETQLNRRVELNLAVQRLERQLSQTMNALQKNTAQ